MTKINLALFCEWGDSCNWTAHSVRVSRWAGTVGGSDGAGTYIETRRFCAYHLALARLAYGPDYEIMEL